MKRGCFRIYFKIPFINYGIKFARLVSWKEGNALPRFFTGITMNFLERARYRWYTKFERMWHWGRHIKINEFHGKAITRFERLKLCPTYFSCGLFSIVKHLETDFDPVEYGLKAIWKNGQFDSSDPNHERINRRTGYFTQDDFKIQNFGVDKKERKWYLLDYGNFVLCKHNNLNVTNLDYA